MEYEYGIYMHSCEMKWKSEMGGHLQKPLIMLKPLTSTNITNTKTTSNHCRWPSCIVGGLCYENHRSLGPELHHAALMFDIEKSVGEEVEGNLLAYRKQSSNKHN